MTSFNLTEHSERTLLGVCLQGDDPTLDLVTSSVSEDDFSLDSHRRIFACITKMYAERIPVNISTVTQELGRKLEQTPGAGLTSLISLPGCRIITTPPPITTSSAFGSSPASANWPFLRSRKWPYKPPTLSRAVAGSSRASRKP